MNCNTDLQIYLSIVLFFIAGILCDEAIRSLFRAVEKIKQVSPPPSGRSIMPRWTRASQIMTEQEALRLQEEYPGLRYTDVTTYSDPERMVMITSPICKYCGAWVTTGRCLKCGAA